MPERIAADALIVLHFIFIVFVLFGGLAALRWRWVVVAHIPAALWGALIEFSGWICPLTPLEQTLRQRAGQTGYTGSFIEHYLLPIIYPSWLDRPTQLALGLLVIVLNVTIYAIVLRRYRNRKRLPDAH